MTERSFVEVKDLRREFDVSKPWLNRVLEGGEKQYLKAVDGVSFSIAKGERDDDALTHASGKFVRITVDALVRRRNADFGQQIDRAPSGGRG